ncbi:mitochondrial outer membrane protein porin 5-like [Iris pallida]|uniref:Mitochondrial outer membrane protein porin 5-like n=1 Tax=Iris pallida TaxID=29817 RepID=A0AAX6FET1_IRIPA|nr:mitochondrial outer membrane protein porin 5-like [Iris pallida]
MSYFEIKLSSSALMLCDEGPVYVLWNCLGSLGDDSSVSFLFFLGSYLVLSDLLNLLE